MSDEAIILFMRYPETGKVKSRLAATIGPHEALKVFQKLVRRTLGMLFELKWFRPQVQLFLFFTPPDKKSFMEEMYPGPWEFIPQEGSHLGERMARAFDHVMARGCRRIVMIGSDIADMEMADLDEAFEALCRGQAVLGPAADGGFYLIGLSQTCPAAFESESWGTSEVFQRTYEILSCSGSLVHKLEERRDIDRADDLQWFDGNPLFRDRLSVIVPTLNLPDQLESWLKNLQAELWPDDEIIVVQGQEAVELGNRKVKERESCKIEMFITSQPSSLLASMLPSHSIRWLISPKGRGMQLNEGAWTATGDIFLFLHDDCSPPPHFGYFIRKSTRSSRMSMGCFQLAFSSSTPALDKIAQWANFRTRWFKLPYGDQGFFCRCEVFQKVGGFRKPFLMEDVDFVRRCRREGRLAILPYKICTSPRRYLQKGILRASLQNHLNMLLYSLGVDDKRLYGMYYKS
jgi:rSAM/selenodomain-associated transferase 1/rSAM/selenodomain-associated transferase 2